MRFGSWRRVSAEETPGAHLHIKTGVAQMADKNNAHHDTSNDTEMPLPLDGSELHLDLKNQPGEKGDPNHADQDDQRNDEVNDIIQGALETSTEENAISSAMKDAVK
jgi:hypothetical protein